MAGGRSWTAYIAHDERPTEASTSCRSTPGPTTWGRLDDMGASVGWDLGPVKIPGDVASRRRAQSPEGSLDGP